MYLRASLLVALLLFPAISCAADIGFPAQSVWLSTTKPAQSEKVKIYAVVYNGSDAEISGALTFLVDAKSHETKSLSLDAGESTIVTSTWTAAEGEHTFSARFAGSGVAESEAQVSASITAKVDAPPSVVEQTIEQAKDVSTQIASTSLPIVSAVANKVFDATESFRNAGIEYLESKTADAVEETHSPAVLGTTTVRQVEGFKKEGATSTGAKGVFATIQQTAATGALAVFKSLWLFYPIFVLLLLFIARWLYKWATGPRF